jgi:hypothetical protein
MIVLGSYPIQKLLGREAKDLDLLATLNEFQEYIGAMPTISDKGHAYYKDGYGQIYDCELIWPDSVSLELAELILADPETTFDYVHTAAWVPSLNVLYMLKMSHRYKKNSPHFLKTMRDIHKMRAAGAVIQPEHEAFYKRRMSETYSYGHPKLNQNKQEFFRPEDNFYIYDHDSIHEAVAIGCRPAYTYYSVDGQEVLSSKQKFFEEVTHQIRCRGVYEETCVLALERSQIPNDFKIDRDKSFKMALMKVCTSITSGWFREYAWENYDYVLEMYDSMNENDRNYVDEFNRNRDKLRKYERIAA